VENSKIETKRNTEASRRKLHRENNCL